MRAGLVGSTSLTTSSKGLGDMELPMLRPGEGRIYDYSAFDRLTLGVTWLCRASDVLVARSKKKRKNRRQDLLDRLFCPRCRN